MTSIKKWFLNFATCLWIALLLPLANAQTVVSTELPNTTFIFATPEQGRLLITSDDDWMRLSSSFMRKTVLHMNEPVDAAALKQFLATTVLAWTPAQTERYKLVIASIAKRWRILGLPTPEKVYLVRTDGRDAEDTPYTRNNAIFLTPSEIDKTNTSEDAFVFAHELFHITSRYNPALATRLYRTLGFQPVPELMWPTSLYDKSITNPDAPFNRHAMPLAVEGVSRLIMPLLIASKTNLNYKAGENFFAVLEVKLALIEVKGDRSEFVFDSKGVPIFLSESQSTPYFKRLGENTEYVFHPEETMADNIAFLAVKRAVKNPSLLQQIEVAIQP